MTRELIAEGLTDRVSGAGPAAAQPRRIVAHDLGHWFVPDRPLFRHLDFVFEPGRVYAVTGPSGSGKSTLLSILAGWEQPTEGWIERHGISSTRWVFQNPNGVARRTALDHVALAFIAQGCSRQLAEVGARRLLDRFRLGDVADSLFAELSGGEAQRLMLARGLASAPDLFLVDEPTAQLDRRTALEVSQALGNLAQTSSIVIVATHDEQTRDMATDVLDLGTEILGMTGRGSRDGVGDGVGDGGDSAASGWPILGPAVIGPEAADLENPAAAADISDTEELGLNGLGAKAAGLTMSGEPRPEQRGTGRG